VTACPSVEGFAAVVMVKPTKQRGRRECATRAQQTRAVRETEEHPLVGDAADAGLAAEVAGPSGDAVPDSTSASHMPTANSKNGHTNSPIRDPRCILSSRLPGVVRRRLYRGSLAPVLNPRALA
jgi:hypothetical protein